MGRTASHVVQLPDGKRIGFGLVKRDGTYYVRFLGPQNDRLKRTLDTKKLKEALDRAEKVIAQEYRSLLPRQRVTWEEAEQLLAKKLAEKGRRVSTLKVYVKDMNMIRKFYGAVTGPGDIDESMAETWLNDYTMGKDKRARNTEAKQHSPTNVKVRLAALSGLWNKWFLHELRIVPNNPFAKLQPPKADKPEVKYVTDDQMETFFTWLSVAYPDWQFPRLIFSLKAYTGCRLQDVCGLRADQLKDGGVKFDADQTKGRKARTVPLPADLYESLATYAGKKHLWENYPKELRAVLIKKGVPTHRLMDEFTPKRLYDWILTVFKDFKKATGVHITSHQFRKRAFTLAWNSGIDARRAAIAFGCNVDTLMRHYVKLDEQQTTNDVFGQMAKILGPNRGTQLGHNSVKSTPKDSTEKQ